MTLLCLCIPPTFFVFYAVRLISKESRRLVIPTKSCFKVYFCVTARIRHVLPYLSLK
jgi:hypothetical protein